MRRTRRRRDAPRAPRTEGRAPRANPVPRREPSAAATSVLAPSGAPVPGGRARLARDLGRIERLATRAARRPVALSVAVLDDRRIRALNRERLGHDYPADVLSFGLEDDAAGLVGALALGVGVARREAAARGHSAYHELLLYAVHGTLHLLGHDDHAPPARARMRRAERRWLRTLGVGAVFRPRRRP